ncbi:hypothetical protein SAMN05192534_13019 [Alteribacillus persepolensis]|uniref:Uncharacterized protein n=1 Tax=Alteribacillus persepolensis TaxID=568899 RepID=A0A1G8J8C4_9BACI|nr:hypothetical protein SAMN05192534_13019 [Alteribacillus persepolensis]
MPIAHTHILEGRAAAQKTKPIEELKKAINTSSC